CKTGNDAYSPGIAPDLDNIGKLYAEGPPSGTLSRRQTANNPTEVDNNNPSCSEKRVFYWR
ncbi:hypothetical protein J6590_075317, partial [Homalodisca vitripennis]